MKKSKILAVADAIEKHQIEELGFNMAAYLDEASEAFPDRSGHECGSTACIGGWTVALETGGLKGLEECIHNEGGLLGKASAILGLTRGKGHDLMYEYGTASVTPAQAAFCLRHLAKTGKVDWAKALREA
jgi:hypothetical protein